MKHFKEMRESSAKETRAPKDFRWPNGARVGIFVQIALEAWSDGKWPGVGPMANPLKEGVPDTNALSWADYGPRCGVYNLLRVLDRHQLKCSAVVNGVIAERYPDALRGITRAGHEIVGHSWAMDVMSMYLSEQQERDNIARTTRILTEVGGTKPTGWISPRATAGLLTNRLLAESGCEWHGDRLNDDLPTYIDYGDCGIVGIAISTEVNDTPLHFRHGNPPRMLIEVFQDALEAYVKHPESTCFNVTVHSHVFGRPMGAWAFDKVLEIARANGNVWIGTKIEAARHFRSVIGGKNK